MTYMEIFEEYVEYSKSELEKIAKQNVEDFLRFVIKCENEHPNTADLVVLGCIGPILYADGKLSKKELKLFNKIFNVKWDAKKIDRLIVALHELNEEIETIYQWGYNFACIMNKEERLAYMKLLLCFMAIDGKMSNEEGRYFYNIDQIEE